MEATLILFASFSSSERLFKYVLFYFTILINIGVISPPGYRPIHLETKNSSGFKHHPTPPLLDDSTEQG